MYIYIYMCVCACGCACIALSLSLYIYIYIYIYIYMGSGAQQVLPPLPPMVHGPGYHPSPSVGGVWGPSSPCGVVVGF